MSDLPLPKFNVTDKVEWTGWRYGYGYVVELYSSDSKWVYEIAHNDRADEDDTSIAKECDLELSTR